MESIKFPNILFGTSTSAYQIEGAWDEDGKSVSILDTQFHKFKTTTATAERLNTQLRATPFFKSTVVGFQKGVKMFPCPNKTIEQSLSTNLSYQANSYEGSDDSGDIACDSYHKIDEDVSLLKQLGVQVYRFSISWPRILPKGQDIPNPKGIDYYKRLIEKLIAEDIKPMVTLYHWDLPQELQDLGGWANPDIINYFVKYCRLVFDLFGKDVKLWVTLNEPRMVCQGYGGCDLAPQLGKKYSGIEDYKAMRNLILAHGRVYRMYEKEFKIKQKGELSICLDAGWMFPSDKNKKEDRDAAELSLQSNVGVFIEPLISGQFPKIVLDSIKKTNQLRNINYERLIPFNDDEKKILIGAYDFMAFNYYFSMRVTPLSDDIKNDCKTTLKEIDQGVTPPDMGKPPNPNDIRDGFTALVNWMNDKFYVLSKLESRRFFICENGTSKEGEEKVRYHQEILEEIHKAKYTNNINIFGYCVWSFMDSFEWKSGYSVKYGIYSVNFNDKSRPRSKKPCFDYFQKLFKTKKLAINKI